MTWITPKTDWTADDYYNLEDAQRIAGNIMHLKDMAAEIYPSSANIRLLLLREIYYSSGVAYNYYGLWTVTITGMQIVYPESYNYTDLLLCDYNNYLTLMKLILLSEAPAVETITAADRVYIPYTINHSSPTSYQFTGEAIRQKINGPGTSADPLNAFWFNLTNYNNRCVCYSNWDNPGGRASMVVGNYRLENARFWLNTELNNIERWIWSTYDTFTRYIGG